MATIVVQHQIKDPDTFFGLTEEVTGNAPEGVQVRQFCPNQDRSKAICLWDAGSLESLQGYLESVAGPEVTENTYFVVDEQNAFGLPQQATASA